ncbi:hypothetical protein Q5752_003586 [Cryptotrichosporon argae]
MSVNTHTEIELARHSLLAILHHTVPWGASSDVAPSDDCDEFRKSLWQCMLNNARVAKERATQAQDNALADVDWTSWIHGLLTDDSRLLKGLADDAEEIEAAGSVINAFRKLAVLAPTPESIMEARESVIEDIRLESYFKRLKTMADLEQSISVDDSWIDETIAKTMIQEIPEMQVSQQASENENPRDDDAGTPDTATVVSGTVTSRTLDSETVRSGTVDSATVWSQTIGERNLDVANLAGRDDPVERILKWLAQASQSSSNND